MRLIRQGKNTIGEQFVGVDVDDRRRIYASQVVVGIALLGTLDKVVK